MTLYFLATLEAATFVVLSEGCGIGHWTHVFPLWHTQYLVCSKLQMCFLPSHKSKTVSSKLCVAAVHVPTHWEWQYLHVGVGPVMTNEGALYHI